MEKPGGDIGQQELPGLTAAGVTVMAGGGAGRAWSGVQVDARRGFVEGRAEVKPADLMRRVRAQVGSDDRHVRACWRVG